MSCPPICTLACGSLVGPHSCTLTVVGRRSARPGSGAWKLQDPAGDHGMLAGQPSGPMPSSARMARAMTLGSGAFMLSISAHWSCRVCSVINPPVLRVVWERALGMIHAIMPKGLARNKNRPVRGGSGFWVESREMPSLTRAESKREEESFANSNQHSYMIHISVTLSIDLAKSLLQAAQKVVGLVDRGS